MCSEFVLKGEVDPAREAEAILVIVNYSNSRETAGAPGFEITIVNFLQRNERRSILRLCIYV